MDCLVTTLQGVVNDDSLMKIGEMRIRVNSDKLTDGVEFVRYYSEGVQPFVIRTKDGSAKLTTNSNGANLVSEIEFTQELFKNQTIYFAPGQYDVSIINKSGIGVISSYNASGLGIDSSCISRMPKIRFFAWANPSAVFDVSNLRDFPDIESIYLEGDKIIGNLYGLKKVKNIKIELSLIKTMINDDVTRLFDCNIGKKIVLENNLGLTGDVMSAISHNAELEYLSFIRSTNLVGNVSSIRGLNKLQSLYINITNIACDIEELGTFISLTTFAGASNPNVYGTIESMVAKFRSYGRTSGNLTLDYGIGLSKVTYNGQSMVDYCKNNLGSKESPVVSWTANTITIS